MRQRLVAESRIELCYHIEKRTYRKILGAQNALNATCPVTKYALSTPVFAAFIVVARLGLAGAACGELGVCRGGAATCRPNAAPIAREAEPGIPVNTLS
jgi:hypothetical protein